MHFAEIIKERVTTRAACEMYGIRVNPSGFALCVAHSDRRPSMKVYDGNRGWYCFACNTGGDVIRLVQLALCVDYKTAINRLNDDFALHLPLNGSVSPFDRNRVLYMAESRRRLIAQNEALKREAEEEYWKAFDVWWAYERQRLLFAPKSPDEDFHPFYAEALHRLPELKYNLDVATDRRMTHGK